MSDPHHRIATIETALLTASTIELRCLHVVDWYPFLDLPQGRYGWVYPMRDGALADLVMHACPELIAKQTEDLGEHDTYRYVGTISWMAAKYLALLGDRLDSPTVEQVMDWQAQIESDLYDLDPSALQLFSQVQLTVLDA